MSTRVGMKQPKKEPVNTPAPASGGVVITGDPYLIGEGPKTILPEVEKELKKAFKAEAGKAKVTKRGRTKKAE